MKRAKMVIILSAVLVLIVAAIIGIKAIKEHIDTISTVDEVVFESSVEELTAVKWTRGNVSLAFNRAESGDWKQTEDADFPVDKDKMESFLEDYSSIHASFVITDVEDYSQYGLDEPEGSITLTVNNTDTTITFGGYSAIDQKRYITIGNGVVYLIDKDPLDSIVLSRDELIKNDEIPQYDDIKEFVLTGDNTLELVHDTAAEHSYNNNDDYFLKEEDNYLAISSVYAEGVIGYISEMEFDSYASYTATKEDLSKYGLDRPSLTATLKGISKADEDGADQEGITTVYIGMVKDDKENTSCYARLENSEMIYAFNSVAYTQLLESTYNSLRFKSLMACDNDQISNINATSDGSSYTIEHVTEGDELDEFRVNGEFVIADDALKAVRAIQVTNFAENGYAVIKKTSSELTEEGGEAEPVEERVLLDTPGRIKELAVTVGLTGEQFPTRVLEFYRFDGESCIAVVDGELVGLVSRASVIDAREAIYDIVL